MAFPTVSIIVPTYNRAERLKLCIGSLLLLDYPTYEIIVVNDGSTDATETYLAFVAGQVTAVTIAHAGRSAARNTGIAVARGEVVAFTDDDCVVDPLWLARLTEPFVKPDVVGTSGSVIYVAENYVPNPAERVVENRDARWPMTANVAYRTAAVLAVGGFDVTFDRYEDKELALRMWQQGRIVAVPEARVYHQPTEEAWPEMSYAVSSSAWVRMKRMHDLSVDKNNPAPVLFGCILMPRRYVALGWRTVALPLFVLWLRSRETGRVDRARYEIRMWWFLLRERMAIWKEAIHQKVFLV